MFAPSESDIQAKMQRIEQIRQIGGLMDPSEMDAAGQEALKRLLAGKQPAAQPPGAPQMPPPQVGQPLQPPPPGGGGQVPPPSGMAPQQPPTGGMPPPQAMQPQPLAPPQGGVWADAEAQQKHRAMQGLPGVR